jgi:MFS family permease
MVTGSTLQHPRSGRHAISVLSTRFGALQHRNFQLFFAGQLISLIGSSMQSMAQLWLIWRLTHSAALLGVLGFASQIPILVLASLGGYFGDRYNRHRGVIWTQSSAMVLAFLLAGLTLAKLINVWELIVIAFLAGVVSAFDVPIRQAFLVQMVGQEDLPNAIALNSSIFNGAQVVGPAIAGFVIAWVHEGWCFFLNGASFLAVIGALLAMRIERQQGKPPSGSPMRSLAGGFQYAMNDWPTRSTLLLLSLLSMLVMQYLVLLPIFASDVLHRGVTGLGLLTSAAGVGALVGALQFATRRNFKGLRKWIAAMSTMAAVGLIAFSESHRFWVSVLFLFFIGFASTSQMAATNTLVQNRVPDELRSRVMAVYATMFLGTRPIGSLLAGGVAKHIGAQYTLVGFGLICLIGTVVFLVRVVLRANGTPAVAGA